MKLHTERNSFLSEFSKETLKDRYLLEGEDPQDGFARAATAFCDDEAHATRMYEYMSHLWFSSASPVSSNAPIRTQWSLDFEQNFSPAMYDVARGQPISCYLNYVPDSRKGLGEHYTENIWLGSMGGGIGGYWGDVRSDGEATSAGSRSTGTIPFLKVVDSEMLAVAQGVTRRGSYAAYYDVAHPEIMEFLDIRKPTGGDVNRKALNLHQAVNLPNKFMRIIERCTNDPTADSSWDLIDPHSNKVTETVCAKEIWQKIVDTRMQTGEPFILFIDTANEAFPEALKAAGLRIRHSNLCVVPETKILTKSGYQNIIDCIGNETIWNGSNWSNVEVVKTGEEQKILKVVTDSGFILECTEYHKFICAIGYNGKTKEVQAKDLVNGDKLIKFDLPTIQGDLELENAYVNGFFSADGCSPSDGSKDIIYLYHEKRDLLSKFEGCYDYMNTDESVKRITLRCSNLLDKFLVPDSNYTVKSRIDWLAGYADGDGTIAKVGNNKSLQIASIEREFLVKIQLMLQELGIYSKVTLSQKAGKRLLPANDGTGKSKYYECKELYRILITHNNIIKLKNLGFRTNRLILPETNAQRDATHFIKIVDVLDEDRVSDTYCFTDKTMNRGMFNGICTSQCTEIMLAATEEKTAVCCLSSPNLEYWDEWKDNPMFIPDIVRYLDNVLEYFIQNAPESMHKAVKSAREERSIGIGALGWHYLLQKKSIPFESAMATSLNKKIFKHMHEQGIAATKDLAMEKGEPKLLKGTGRRNAHVFAVAPNASTSILMVTSPSIEPVVANIFTHKTLSGSWTVRNKYLDALLKSRFDSAEQAHIWKSILLHEGSVQHLNVLTEWERDVFKTAFEIDQEWVLQHAVDRQPYICQGQSLNIYLAPEVPVKYVHDLYLKAWQLGLKSLYYQRTKATRRAELVGEVVERQYLISDSECLSCEG